jgi:hypothetical protein
MYCTMLEMLPKGAMLPENSTLLAISGDELMSTIDSRIQKLRRAIAGQQSWKYCGH